MSGLFFSEAVRPVLDSDLPGLRYSAALNGTGPPEQFGDSTDLVSRAARRPALRKLYE